jgi:SAM-dependent methyltransferase
LCTPESEPATHCGESTNCEFRAETNALHDARQARHEINLEFTTFSHHPNSPTLQLRHTASTEHSTHSTLRQSAARALHNHPSIPALAVIACSGIFGVALAGHADIWLQVATELCLSGTAFVWGYSTHGRRHAPWAPLTQFKRRQYAEVWDSLMDSSQPPRVAVAGVPTDEELGPSTSQCLENLLELARVDPNDDVLEIGCGTGRIGLKLAPHCRCWTGADISGKMLALAAHRLRALQNVRLTQLEGDLAPFSANYFDVVYATSVFGHLDEMDRWRYIEEAFRVLRPGGRLVVDNIDIESESGWTMFLNDVHRYHELQRPSYMPRFSTGSELENYAQRAGFLQIAVHRRPPLVVVTSTKPLNKESTSNLGRHSQTTHVAASAPA